MTLPFEKLGLSTSLAEVCSEMGFKGFHNFLFEFLYLAEPTPIQMKCIPAILAGDNVLGQAKTGSGKTAAFALPILHCFSEDPYSIYAIVLTASRELAFQIDEQFIALGKSLNLQHIILVGGIDKTIQSLSLSRHPHIIVATPGRMADHIRSGTIELKYLNEADRLLSDPIINDLKTILGVLPSRQTLLFAATLPEAWIKNNPLSKLDTSRKLFIGCDDETDDAGLKSLIGTVKTLKQNYVFISQIVKECYLVYLLTKEYNFKVPQFVNKEESEDAIGCEDYKSAIVFTSTCNNCQFLTEFLLEMKINCVWYLFYSVFLVFIVCIPALIRLASLAKFRNNQANVLIATDVASRGLDIPTVALVINYDVPRSVDYLHRVGRTARAGRVGHAISLVTQYDVELFLDIEGLIHEKIVEKKISDDDILSLLPSVLAAKRKANLQIEAYSLKESDFRATRITKRKERNKENKASKKPRSY